VQVGAICNENMKIDEAIFKISEKENTDFICTRGMTCNGNGYLKF
jgi:hypothetical protein